MRNLLVLISAFALLSSARAQDRPAPGQRPAPPAQKPRESGESKPAPDVSARLHGALDDLAKKAAARGATREDFARVSDLVKEHARAYETDDPHAASLRDRALARIQQLENRAKTAALEKEELDQVHDHVLDLQLESAVARLKARAAAGQISREDYAHTLAALDARAQAAKAYDPDADAISAKLKSAIEAVEKRGNEAKAQDFEPIMGQVADLRLSNAMGRLEKRSVSRGAIPADFDDVSSAFQDRASAPGANPNAAEIGKKLAAKLDEMKRQVESGQLKREDFAEMRAMLTHRAQEAAAPRK